MSKDTEDQVTYEDPDHDPQVGTGHVGRSGSNGDGGGQGITTRFLAALEELQEAVPSRVILASDDGGTGTEDSWLADTIDGSTVMTVELVELHDLDSGHGAEVPAGIGLAGGADSGSGRDMVSIGMGSADSGRKRCTRCGELLPLAMFGWITAAGRKYKAPHCRACDTARNRARARSRSPGLSACYMCGAPIDGADGFRCRACNRARSKVRRERARAGIVMVRSEDFGGLSHTR